MEFWDREVKLNSTGMEPFDLGRANQSALGLVCATCGFVHEFLGDVVSPGKTDHGYPPSRCWRATMDPEQETASIADNIPISAPPHPSA